MTRDKLIKKAVNKLSKLSEKEIWEVSDFTEFLLHKIEEKKLTEGIQEVTSDSESFEFLKEEEGLYSKSDLKKVFK
jgi:hypothetical protein